MAAAYLEITELPRNVIAGFQHQFRLTARQASGAVETGYTGTVAFSSSDAAATLPATYTFTGPDAGTRLFKLRLATNGSQKVAASDGTLATYQLSTVSFRPPGWGTDDFGLLPYGDAATSIGVSLSKAAVFSTREVDVTLSNLVQDNSPYLDGDALNPNTWTLQRLDTTAFLNVVSVVQVGTYTYRLTTLEEFGPVTVTHRVGSTTLKDVGGFLVVAPRNADFLGLLDEDKATVQRRLGAKQVSTQDIANPQVPRGEWFAGTLQIGANGDYVLDSGAALVRKLILRRLMTTPGDFFHLPSYGVGIRTKEPIPAANLGKLKTAVEQQCAQETEIENIAAYLSLSPANGILTIKVKATLKKTGEAIEIGFKSNSSGVVL